MAAIRVLRTLQDESRAATAEEQRTLARWGSWGATGLAQVLDESRTEFAGDRATLRGLLNDDEYAAARRTTINAHYTDLGVVTEVWGSLERLGFTGGQVLEPGCGSGVFIGRAPAAAQMTGVELDPVTAGIAAALYPQAQVRAESFAQTRLADSSFDTVVGNVPFADVVLHDPLHNAGRLPMHNHFIVKSLALTRPGGLVAVLTSRYTMDAQNPSGRRAIHELGDLVGAVRLPTGAHRRSAGTEAVTDLLILRRREPDRTPGPFDVWGSTSPVVLPTPESSLEAGAAADGEPVRLNTWWQTHPEMVLGQMLGEVGLHGVFGVSVIVDDVSATPRLLRDALIDIEASASAAGLRWTERTADQQQAIEERAGLMPALDHEREGHIAAHDDGSFTVVEAGVHVPLQVPQTGATEMRALLTMRDQARVLLDTEARSLTDDPTMDQTRAELRGLWQDYVARYGPINRFTLRNTGRAAADGDPIQARIVPTPVRKLLQDPYGPLVTALESFDEATQTAEPAGILVARQIEPRRPILGADSALDALNIVLDQQHEVDLQQIADLTGQSVQEARAELGPAIWEVPPTIDQAVHEADGDNEAEPEWVTAAAYLSGDVREKLRLARVAALEDPDRWRGHVEALEAVLPTELGPEQIQPRLGASWITDADHQQFLRDLIGNRWATVSRVGSTWSVKDADYGLAAHSDWGIPEMPAGRLLQRIVQQQPIIVTDTIDDRQVINPVKTEAAQDKARLMQERFATWVWEDPQRANRLCEEYNRLFNSVVLRDYTSEGERLTLPGLTKNFTPRPHQRAAVARMINEPSVGLFHAVGAGKTAEMVMGCTELRRLGLVRKPVVVVPNHMLEQVTREWLQLYPRAMLLAASGQDIGSTPESRRRFVARAATSDWDAVIMTHSSFGKIAMSPAEQARYQQRQLEQTRRELDAARERADGGRAQERSIKQAEKILLAREEKLREKLNMAHDPGITFEATGIDYVVVDEMHLFKNLTTVSNIRDAAIVPGSDRALDLHMKVEYLRGQHGDRVMTGATATPISNSMSEMHVVMRYLAPEQLERAGIDTFDRWASTFGEVVTTLEVPPSGGTRFVPKDRFAKFVNVPELVTMMHQFADIKTAEDLGLPTPTLAARPDGRRAPTIISVEPSAELDAFMADLAYRTDRVKSRAVSPTEDNNLKIATDGRKASIDVRVADPTVVPTGPTKVSAAADLIAGVWDRTKDNRYLDVTTGQEHPNPGALQIVFCDFSTPGEGWNIYETLRDGLYARGLPLGSVRFIHDAKNDREKARLFAQCRIGGVAVLIGSTAKMGVGTNIQARAVHLVDLDPPWRPADIEQRHGRILRQGNQNDEVLISQIVTAGSFDTFMWQTLERKAKFIGQVMSGRADVREVEGNLGEVQMSYNELKAVSSRNPLLLDLSAAEQELQRFRRLETAHHNNHRRLKVAVRDAEHQLTTIRAGLPALTAAAARSVDTRGDAFSMTISGQTYRKRPDAAAALETWRRSAQVQYGQQADYGPVVVVGGQPIRVTTDGESLSWTVADAPTIRSHDSIRDVSHGLDLGTITRLENLARRVPLAVASEHQRIDELERRISHAEASLAAPFTHTDDLGSAERRYAALSEQMKAASQQDTVVDSQADQAPQRLTSQPPVDQQLAQTMALVRAGFGRPATAASTTRPSIQTLRKSRTNGPDKNDPDRGR
ncbi:lactate dehydrogenase [Microlunatus aurantiacus]|uniref:Lactate dehydrogenase n=1 Tax=Microlunatus aurantiacus TaxID=446786 RepID=A0ABP7DQD6_9ACTN